MCLFSKPAQSTVFEYNFFILSLEICSLIEYSLLFKVEERVFTSGNLFSHKFCNFTFSSDSFNGNVIDFIDTPLTTVWVETNMNGWDNSRYAFNSSRAEFNWSGLSVDQDTYFIAHLNEDEFPIGTVPEPSSLALLSLGIMGAGFFLKKKEKM
jgi:hypothetical protein